MFMPMRAERWSSIDAEANDARASGRRRWPSDAVVLSDAAAT